MFSPRKPAHNGSMFDFNQSPSMPVLDVNSSNPTPPRKAHTGPAYNIHTGSHQYPYSPLIGTPTTPTSHPVRPIEAHTGQHRNPFQQYQSPVHRTDEYFGSPQLPQTPSTPLRPTSIENSSPFFHQTQRGGGVGSRGGVETPTLTPGHVGHHLHHLQQQQPGTPTTTRRLAGGMMQPCSLYPVSSSEPSNIAYQSSSPASRRANTPHKPSSTRANENAFNFQTPTTTRWTTSTTNQLADSVPQSPSTAKDLLPNFFCRGTNAPRREDEQFDTALNNNDSCVTNNNIVQQQQQQQQQQPYQQHIPDAVTDMRYQQVSFAEYLPASPTLASLSYRTFF